MLKKVIQIRQLNNDGRENRFCFISIKYSACFALTTHLTSYKLYTKRIDSQLALQHRVTCAVDTKHIMHTDSQVQTGGKFCEFHIAG